LTRLDGQGGVWPQPNALNITASGTPDMNVHVDRGSGMTQGSQNTAQGNYPFFNTSSTTVSIAASNTQQRIDSIVVHNKDTFYSGTTDTTEIYSVAGSPGSGSPPNLSILDNNYLEIGRVTVRANTTSILSTDITQLQHLLPVGLDIPLSSELSNTGSFHGHPRVNTTSGEFEWWDANASAWRGQKWVSYTPTWTGFTALGTGFVSQGRYFKTGTRVLVNAMLTAGTGASMGTAGLGFTIPFTAANVDARDNWPGVGLFRPTGVGGNIFNLVGGISNNATGCGVSALTSSQQWTTPGLAGYSFVAGTVINFQVEYESAS
jgi:hypothetical protein